MTYDVNIRTGKVNVAGCSASDIFHALTKWKMLLTIPNKWRKIVNYKNCKHLYSVTCASHNRKYADFRAKMCVAPECHMYVELTKVECEYYSGGQCTNCEGVSLCIGVSCGGFKKKNENDIVGIKHDADKNRFDLLPWNAITEVVRVYTFGAKKYGDNNWQKVEPTSRYEAALMRHFTAWKSGEKCDPETGIHHLAHAAWNVIALLWFELRSK